MNLLDDFEYTDISGFVGEQGSNAAMPVRIVSVQRKSQPGLHGYGLATDEALIDLLRREENQEVIETS